MKKHILLLIFLMLTSSCAGLVGPGAGVGDESGEAVVPEEEVADTGCAYFYFLWGRSAQFDSRLDEAQEAFEKALVCDPHAVTVMRQLASLLVKMGKHNQAVMWMRQVVAASPDDVESLFWLAGLYEHMGNYDEAVNTYHTVLEVDAGNLDALLYLGALHARNRRYDEAREILERLIGLDEQSYAGHKYLARLYRELRYFDKAIGAYERALALNWSAPLAMEAAEVLEQQGRDEDAVELYRGVLEEDEASVQARERLANIYLRQGDVDQALAELEEMRQYSQDVRKVDFFIGRVLLDQDRLAAAVAKFSQLLAEEPEQTGARYMLAVTYLKMEDNAKAKEMLRAIPVTAPGYEEAFILLIRILQEEGDFVAIESALQAAIADPAIRKEKYYVILASVYHRQAKDDQAQALFKQGLVDFPNNAALLFEYAMFLESVGDQQAAMLNMGTVLELEPENPLALNYVGYTWAENGVNLEQALRYIEKAVDLKPEDGFIRDSLGWVYYKMGDMARAVRELEKALEMTPDDPTINEHLGDAYLGAGAVEQAVRQYERAESLFEKEEKKAGVRKKIEELKP